MLVKWKSDRCIPRRKTVERTREEVSSQISLYRSARLDDGIHPGRMWKVPTPAPTAAPSSTPTPAPTAAPTMPAAAADCTLGVACNVTVAGVTGTFADPHRLFASHMDGGCNPPAGRTLSAQSFMPTFALGIPLNETVGAYAICWQYALASSAVPIGELYLHGAKPLDFDTRVGQRTQISLNGSGLTPSNMLLLAELPSQRWSPFQG